MSATTIFLMEPCGVPVENDLFAIDFMCSIARVSVGKEIEDGTIADANYVWLSAWQLENINNKFLIPIDLEAYRELKNHISKALVPLLQIWLYSAPKLARLKNATRSCAKC